jgi:hypothetical protein
MCTFDYFLKLFEQIPQKNQVEDCWFTSRSVQTLYHVICTYLTSLREVQVQKLSGPWWLVVVAASQGNCFWKESVGWCITQMYVLQLGGRGTIFNT